jgi:UDP-glucose 4-epimerase
LRILLTGGLGYLGGRLAQTLLSASHEVTLGTRRPATSAPWAPAATVSVMDWSSEREIARACESIDAIVHLAGMNARDCAGDPVAALAFNGVGTAMLVRAAAAQGVRRLVFLSTAHVYGAALTGAVDESTRPIPLHPYATSHRAGEDAVLSARDSRGLQGLVVRLSNSFGAPAHAGADCWTLVINDLCRQAVLNRRMVLRTGGQQRRDFIAMSEACRAIAHLVTAPGAAAGEPLFNVGGEWSPTLLDVAALLSSRVQATLGYVPELQKGAAPDTVGTGELEYRIARLKATGFEPRPAAVAEELDRLIRFCAANSEALHA